MVTKIIKPFVEHKLIPKVTEIVEMYITQLKLKQDIKKSQIDALCEHIFNKLMHSIFKRDQQKIYQYDLHMAIENQSMDSLDPDQETDTIIDDQGKL